MKSCVRATPRQSTRTHRSLLSARVRAALRCPLHPSATSTLVLCMTAALASAATAEPFPAAIALPSLLPEFGGDGSVGFVLQRAYGEGEAAIGSGAGDLNDDGVDDIVIGTRFGDYAYVVFGRNVGQSASLRLSSSQACCRAVVGMELPDSPCTDRMGPVGR